MNPGQAIWKITILTDVLVTATLIYPPVGMSISPVYQSPGVIPAKLPEEGPLRGGRGIQPAAGKLLIATKRVKGSIFEDSVILLIDYSNNGATGVIINRPTDIPLHILFPDLKSVRDLSDKVYIGGPVEPGRVIMLIKTSSPPEGSLRLVEDVFVSSNIRTLEKMSSNRAPDERLRLYSGYAGWGPGQLDTEILRGSWSIADATAELIFDTPANKIRDKLKHPRTMEVNAPSIRTNSQLSKLNFDNALINSIFLTNPPGFGRVILY